jgi:hypothetical protein
VLDPANYRRYARYAEIAERIDAKAVVALYVRLYPLFQQSYRQLGYGDAQFNDRLVQVIDHLLQAPIAPQPVPLAQESAFYTFADPELEARSAGHKALMRMGPENADRIKAKLRQIRAELVAQAEKARAKGVRGKGVARPGRDAIVVPTRACFAARRTARGPTSQTSLAAVRAVAAAMTAAVVAPAAAAAGVVATVAVVTGRRSDHHAAVPRSARRAAVMAMATVRNSRRSSRRIHEGRNTGTGA